MTAVRLVPAIWHIANDTPDHHEVVNTSAVGDDGWAQIAPFGDFPGQATLVHANGQVEAPKPALQRMARAAAEAMVARFRAPWSRIMRWARGLPIFHGHPDQPGRGHLYTDRGQKGIIADLEVRDAGLFARPVFNNEGQQLIESTPGLAFSARWSAEPAGTSASGVVILRPTELLSAGLTTNPNLPVQAINEMDLTALRAALKRLGISIADDADLAAIVAAVGSAAEAAEAARTEAANDRTALATARTELETARTQLTAANTRLTTADADLGSLRTELANERAARAVLLIDAAIAAGRITEADRAGYVTQFANDWAAANTALAAARPRTALPTTSKVGTAKPVADTATLAARQGQAHQLINERVQKGAKYDEAFQAVLKERPDLFGQPSQN